MPAYNFQRQFVPMILDGSKSHTIRKARKRPTKPGDVIKMFVGLRTKNCFQFAEVPCVKTEPILIKPWQSEAWIWHPEEPGDLHYVEGKEIGSYRLLNPEEVNDMAHHDGFEDVYDFFDFFKRYKSDALYFDIVWWDPKELKDLSVHLGPKDIRGPIEGAHADLLIIDDLGDDA